MSTIKLFQAKNNLGTIFSVVAPNEQIAKEYSSILLAKGYFPGANQVVSLAETQPTDAFVYYGAIQRSVEAISWQPSSMNISILRALTPHLKPLTSFLNVPGYELFVNDGKSNVFIANNHHVSRLSEVAEVPFINWTFAYDSERKPVRNYLSLEAYILALQSTIIAHDKLYEDAQSIITDSEYDQLYATLVQLEQRYPYMVHPASPTQRIVTSDVVTSLEKVTHSRPMISLDKTTTDEGLIKFIQLGLGEKILGQNKEDGLTVVGHYRGGKQYDFVSRGNSTVGERLFHSCSQISNLPKEIDFKGNLELRFEVVIPFAEFERVNKDGKYSNPRNLASGTVRSLDGSLTKERGLKAYVIEVVSIEGMEFTSDSDQLEFIRSLGFETSTTETFFGEGTDYESEKERLLKWANEYNEKVRPTLPHLIDGLVFKYDSLKLRENLGETSKYPRWAIAYKFSSQDAMTKLNNVVVQIGKTGQLTPVAEFDMIEIDGVEVRRATLHNYTLIEEKDIRIGDQIQVARANDVIPQVVKSYSELRTGEERIVKVPTVCPACKNALKRDGEHIFCVNEQCLPIVIGKLQHFVSRNAMNIDGCGEKTVSLLFKSNLIKSIPDIYKLQHRKSELLKLDKFGDKKVENMLQGIEASKNQPLNNFIYSLSINLIGQTASKAIAKVYRNMHELLAEDVASLRLKLMNLEDFGEKMVNSFVEYMSKVSNRTMLTELLELGLTMESDYVAPATDSKITDQVFVITGTLSESRNDFKKLIESLGGKVSGTVSKKTNYLLMGDGANGTSKHQDAIKHNVTILSEADFRALI